ncbi:MAG: hypothetical protein AB8B85_02745 [Paracoccaceae bacterium]
MMPVVPIIGETSVEDWDNRDLAGDQSLSSAGWIRVTNEAGEFVGEVPVRNGQMFTAQMAYDHKPIQRMLVAEKGEQCYFQYVTPGMQDAPRIPMPLHGAPADARMQAMIDPNSPEGQAALMSCRKSWIKTQPFTDYSPRRFL